MFGCSSHLWILIPHKGSRLKGLVKCRQAAACDPRVLTPLTLVIALQTGQACLTATAADGNKANARRSQSTGGHPLNQSQGHGLSQGQGHPSNSQSQQTQVGLLQRVLFGQGDPPNPPGEGITTSRPRESSSCLLSPDQGTRGTPGPRAPSPPTPTAAATASARHWGPMEIQADHRDQPSSCYKRTQTT